MNKQYGNNMRKLKTMQNPSEDVNNSDTKQYDSYTQKTTSNIEELNQREINTSAESKHQKIYKFVETPF